MKMKKSQLREIIRNIVEELCAKGKAYRKRRMAAGEKSSAYLSGRAVKVCKGQIKGEDVNEGGFGIGEDDAMKKSAKGMAMYGKKAKMERARYKDGGPPVQEQEGEVNVFGYQTKHFDVCPGAQSLYKKITDKKLKDDAIKSAKLHDALFAIEKKALKSGVSKEEAGKAQQIANAIMKLAQRMGLKSEHQYVQGHADKIKEKIKEAMYGTAIHDAPKKKNKQENIDEEIEAKDNTEFKIKLKHLLQKHATNLEKGKKDTEFKLTLKHLLDKHVSKGGEEKDD